VPCDARPEELDVARAVHFVEESLGMEVRRVRSAWAGLRSFVAALARGTPPPRDLEELGLDPMTVSPARFPAG
jgi:hypothetical protein